MCRKFVLYLLVVCCQSVFAEPISFSYNSERDSLTFTGEGSLEQKHVKQALAKYPRTKIVYVGGNVDHVGDNAFNNCNNLETIIFSPSVSFVAVPLQPSLPAPATTPSRTIIPSSTTRRRRSLRTAVYPPTTAVPSSTARRYTSPPPRTG